MIEQQKQASSFLFRPTWNPQEREYDFRALVHCQKAKAAANLAHTDARHFPENTNQTGESAEIYPPTKSPLAASLCAGAPWRTDDCRSE
jgi:hypothetical protein